jgi:hypothetical protein
LRSPTVCFYKQCSKALDFIQANAKTKQPEDPRPDAHSETDEMFQNAGEKGTASLGPAKPDSQASQQAAGTWNI